MHANNVIFKIQAMIDTKMIYNLIAQDLVKKHDILGNNKVLSLMTANRSKLRFYK